MTMHDLIARLNSKLDRASIYRAISLFEVLNIVQRLNIGWKYKIELTDKFAEHHHHLTCLKCGQVISINEGELEDFVHKSARINGFKVTAHQIEIQGYCSRCS
jgi:Fur family ferric uptake transcriptional regulator